MEATAGGQQRAGAPQDGTVLIVEDDDAIREVLALALEGAHHTSAVACDGEQALSWLRQQPSPCLILLELMMPVMNGAAGRPPLVVSTREWIEPTPALRARRGGWATATSAYAEPEHEVAAAEPAGARLRGPDARACSVADE